jgi:hypothetical protein
MKALSQPLYRLLGASGNKVPTYASWKLWPQTDFDSLTHHAADGGQSGPNQLLASLTLHRLLHLFFDH